MGFITTVIILNDAFDQIEKHPEQFVAGIRENMSTSMRQYRGRDGSFAVGNHIPAAQVVGCEHADTIQIIAAGQNRGVSLGFGYCSNIMQEESQIKLLKQLADKFGYRLAKKPSKALT